MSSTNKTTHYDLSQYVGTDKPTYLSDYNGDMAKIDAALYEANTKASSAESNASTALTEAGQALEKANTNEGDIDDLESVTDLLKTNVTTLNNFMNSIKTTSINDTIINFQNLADNPASINQEVHMKKYDLENLKLTSFYGSISITNNNGGSISKCLGFSCQDIVSRIGTGRVIYSIGYFVAVTNTANFSGPLHFDTSSNKLYTPFLYNDANITSMSIAFQACILG